MLFLQLLASFVLLLLPSLVLGILHLSTLGALAQRAGAYILHMPLT